MPGCSSRPTSRIMASCPQLPHPPTTRCPTRRGLALPSSAKQHHKPPHTAAHCLGLPHTCQAPPSDTRYYPVLPSTAQCCVALRSVLSTVVVPSIAAVTSDARSLPPLPPTVLVPILDSHDNMDPSLLMPSRPVAPGSSSHAMTAVEAVLAPAPPAPMPTASMSCLVFEFRTMSQTTSTREHSQLFAEAIYDEHVSHQPLSPYLKQVLDTRHALWLRTMHVITAHIEMHMENLEQDDTLFSVANFFYNESTEQEHYVANTTTSPVANYGNLMSEQEVSQAEGTEDVEHVEHAAGNTSTSSQHASSSCQTCHMHFEPHAIRETCSFYVNNFPYRYVRSQFQDVFESLLRDHEAYPHGVLFANPGPSTAKLDATAMRRIFPPPMSSDPHRREDFQDLAHYNSLLTYDAWLCLMACLAHHVPPTGAAGVYTSTLDTFATDSTSISSRFDARTAIHTSLPRGWTATPGTMGLTSTTDTLDTYDIDACFSPKQRSGKPALGCTSEPPVAPPLPLAIGVEDGYMLGGFKNIDGAFNSILASSLQEFLQEYNTLVLSRSALQELKDLKEQKKHPQSLCACPLKLKVSRHAQDGLKSRIVEVHEHYLTELHDILIKACQDKIETLQKLVSLGLKDLFRNRLKDLVTSTLSYCGATEHDSVYHHLLAHKQ
ncbi:hypothetical protein SELMODRAFT_427127 [Selaginella moellendorffii]|uniref:Uncharacterized protein n=1 Tax=Selaginella moellendorffii TaxID=88036 RepID=D8SYL1_SELML|nr:hypothetical protein SELMODRAFT_427127 [Selaginella moellendorffii]